VKPESPPARLPPQAESDRGKIESGKQEIRKKPKAEIL
jgi:hypothetical protein